MKVLCILSWQPGSRWIWDYLPQETYQVDFAYIYPPKDRFPGYGKLLGYYQRFWRLGLRVFPHLKDYDAIVTWEANTALPVAFLRSLFSHSAQASPPLIILNFVLKGRPIYDFIPLVRFAMRSVNRITCLSEREIQAYAKVLNYPLERCQKLQGPFRDFFEEDAPSLANGDYIFSAGRSQRDYRTLIEAVRGLDVEVVINARNFDLKDLQAPENVTLNSYLPFDDYLNLLKQARFVVLPLKEEQHAAGETFMIQAMTAQKAVVVSKTYSSHEMIEHGVNGLLVPPADPLALRQAIQTLLGNPELALQIGQKARQDYLTRWSFPIVSQQIDEILKNLARKRVTL